MAESTASLCTANCLWYFNSVREESQSRFPENREFFIAVSMKNRKFSNKWLNSVLTDINLNGGRGIITLVDLPYFTHAMCRHERLLDKFDALQVLQKIRRENVGRIEKVIRPFESFRYYDWDYFERLTDIKLKKEFEVAFMKKCKVYEMIIEQVKEAVGKKLLKTDLEASTRFVLDETPVLVWLYYKMLPGFIDVYPGKQAPLFWEIESGAIRDELPISCSLAASSSPLCYAEAYVR